MAKRAKDLTNLRFGRLLVTKRAGTVGGRAEWRWVCDCGNEGKSRSSYLLKGDKQSCGCLRQDHMKKIATKHSERNSPEYTHWRSMIRRCEDRNHKSWPQYGGSGVTVCTEWRESFETFLTAVGRRPTKDHTLDRIDNTRGYDPTNTRWATKAQQSRNRRTVVLTQISVNEIRHSTEKSTTLAGLYGVSARHITDVRSGRRWADCEQTND